MVFWRAKFLILVKLNLSVFPLWIVLFLTSVKILCLTLDTKDFLILFKKFYILYLTHFKLHFIYSVRLRLRFLFILMSVQYCTFVKKLGHICVGVFLGFLFDPSIGYVHTTLSSFLSYMKLFKQRERKTFKRKIALNLEYRNLLICKLKIFSLI